MGRNFKIKDKDLFIENSKIFSAKELAVKYNVSITTINRYKKEYGLKKKCVVPDDFVEYAKEHNKKQVSEHYNTYYEIVKKWEMLSGCKCSKKRNAKNRNRDIVIRELSKTNTYASIGKMYGISRQRIEQIIHRDNK